MGRSGNRHSELAPGGTHRFPLSCTWLISEARKLFLINMINAKCYKELVRSSALFSSLISTTISYIHTFMWRFRKSTITARIGLQKLCWEWCTRKGREARLKAADRTRRGEQSTEKFWGLGSNWFCCWSHGLSTNHYKKCWTPWGEAVPWYYDSSMGLQ